MSDIKEQLYGMKYFFAIIALIIVTGIGMEFIYPYAPWILDDNTNPYSEITLFVPGPDHPEHGNYFEVLSDGRLAPLTLLDEEGMRLQSEEGCGAKDCHIK
jgi:hypothetical protein